MAENRAGLQPLEVDGGEIGRLLKANFNVPDIARLTGVSISTVRRRMKAEGLLVASMYSTISDNELYEVMAAILLEKPNTGMKIMKGLLRSRGIRITEERLRAAMRAVDPIGVEQRKSKNRAINRRTYFSPHTHAIWHLDTNMKYRIIVKSCVDGKSRLGIYIDVANNNTAISSLDSFIQGVRRFGVPSRTRSDKGKENTLIARFMLTSRGVGRGSHITGRSVHNQRIERFWGNINKVTCVHYQLFTELEQEGLLNIDDDNQLYLLHLVFLPRIQRCLEDFRLGWNEHPLSTERNYSPSQLALLHADPEHPAPLPMETLEEIYQNCREESNVPDEVDYVRNPPRIRPTIPDIILQRLHGVDMLRESLSNGKDVYMYCYNLIFGFESAGQP